MSSFPPPPPYSPVPEITSSFFPDFVMAYSNQPMEQINSQPIDFPTLPPPPQFPTDQCETTMLPFGSSQQSSQLHENLELQIPSAPPPPATSYNTDFRATDLRCQPGRAECGPGRAGPNDFIIC